MSILENIKSTSEIPVPSAPYAIGDDGKPFYTSCPEGIVNDSAMYEAWYPHAPYAFFSDKQVAKDDPTRVSAYINPYKGSINGYGMFLSWMDRQPMRAPYNATFGDPKKAGYQTNKFDFELVIDDATLLATLNQFDNVTRLTGMARIAGKSQVAAKAAWFKYTVTPEEVAKYYKPLVKKREKFDDKTNAVVQFKPTIKTKIILNGPSRTKVYKYYGRLPNGEFDLRELAPENVGIHLFKKGGKYIPNVKLSQIYFIGTEKWGISVTCKEILIFPEEEKKTVGFASFSGQVSITKESDHQQSTTNIPVVSNNTNDQTMEDSDEDRQSFEE